MTCTTHTKVMASSTWKSPVYALLTAIAVLGLCSSSALADAPAIGLTEVGSPIWKPTDFQLFTAPAAPFPDALVDTLDALLPLEGPGVVTKDDRLRRIRQELDDLFVLPVAVCEGPITDLAVVSPMPATFF